MQYRLCRHIKANRSKCKSPALRGQDFCYFHDRHHRRHTGTRRANSSSDAPANKPVPLDDIEDRDSVQIALSTVINALAMGRLDTRRATALLYGLQLATSHLHPLPSVSDTKRSA